MASITTIVKQMQTGPKNVRYDDLYKVCEHYFGPPRQKGTSHAVFKTPWQGDPRVNIQEGDAGKAKVYQVKQVLAAIAKLAAIKAAAAAAAAAAHSTAATPRTPATPSRPATPGSTSGTEKPVVGRGRGVVIRKKRNRDEDH